ncbi:MAG: dicarboxylate/amino acid:cation symporter [Lachnospiraceae bacterium]|nr:dicarboxylate/amino acid:cation symporter [Lachnospiraceae bacterium]
MKIRKDFLVNDKSISEITVFIEDTLADFKLKHKDITRILLTVEEVAGSLVEHCDKAAADEDPENVIKVVLKKVYGNVVIELSAKGSEYPLADNVKSASSDSIGDEDEGVQDAIRNILLHSLADDLKYKHKNGTNYISMTILRSNKKMLYQTLGAMAIAIVVGLIFSLCAPAETNAYLSKFVLGRVKTVYMNALKMVVAPVVFFSIVSCIVQFSDLNSLGRIGGKIMGMYMFTTLLAVTVGISVASALSSSSFIQTSMQAADATSITSQTMEVSIADTLVGIVPSDIITPFQKSNMLQLIFMAVLCGIATGLLGKYSQSLSDLFNACNELFLKITTIIIRFMPIAVFCSIASMVMTLGISTIVSLLGMLGLFLLGLLCMMIVYCLLMVVFGRLNPIPFIKKYSSVMLQVFSMASSNASIPINMEACEERLGIKKKVFSLSIPLGATLNMDGTCIYLAIFALCLARIYGVDVSQAGLLSMVISIIVLSVGAPGIPGSGLICLSVLLTQINVPVEAVGLIMGIDSLCGMLRTMSNCLGDVAVSTVVAKTEGEIDMEVYRN